MRVGLAVNSRSQPVILLKPILEEPGTGTTLPIWIGAQEASSNFIITVEGTEAPRRLAHDSMKTVLETVGAEVEVTRIEGGTF